MQGWGGRVGKARKENGKERGEGGGEGRLLSSLESFEEISRGQSYC